MFLVNSQEYRQSKEVVNAAIAKLDELVTMYHGTALATKYQQQRYHMIQNKYILISKLIKGEIRL